MAVKWGRVAGPVIIIIIILKQPFYPTLPEHARRCSVAERGPNREHYIYYEIYCTLTNMYCWSSGLIERSATQLWYSTWLSHLHQQLRSLICVPFFVLHPGYCILCYRMGRRAYPERRTGTTDYNLQVNQVVPVLTLRHWVLGARRFEITSCSQIQQLKVQQKCILLEGFDSRVCVCVCGVCVCVCEYVCGVCVCVVWCVCGACVCDVCAMCVCGCVLVGVWCVCVW